MGVPFCIQEAKAIVSAPLRINSLMRRETFFPGHPPQLIKPISSISSSTPLYPFENPCLFPDGFKVCGSGTVIFRLHTTYDSYLHFIFLLIDFLIIGYLLSEITAGLWLK